MDLTVHTTPGSKIIPEIQPGCWHLEIPAGPQGSYRLAQLDDYARKPRSGFLHTGHLELRLRARVSAVMIPGTWGFGFWNDPFSLALPLGGGGRRFPTLPNAAWFFFASPQNYLSFQDNLPAQGWMAQTFRSANLPAFYLALTAPLLPLLFSARIARRMRLVLRRLIHEDSFAWDLDATDWHEYALIWQTDRVRFEVDQQAFETSNSPQPPLGLVIWIDNQFAALPPHGKLSYGTLENPQPAWLEVEALSLYKGS